MTNDSLIGRQLDEYRIVSLLGRGGMARVYLAVDIGLRRYVALKVIDRPYRADANYVRRFEREAQAIAALDHPRIVRIYRYGQAGDVLYLAMQYIEGADLRTLLNGYYADGGRIPVSDARRIMADLTGALDYAHSRGVIHRDVKPSNIMLDTSGRAVLTDFGLVLIADAGTHGESFGTPEYIAPEQVMSSASAVPQTDIYSLGVLLYEMFTGYLPFNHENPMELALLHVNEAPRPPRELRSDLSPELERVIMKALRKQPEERYATGAELLAALDGALRGEEAPTADRPETGSMPERVSAVYAASALPPLREEDPPAAPITAPLPLSGQQASVARATKRINPALLFGCLALVLMLLCATGAVWVAGRVLNGEDNISWLPLLSNLRQTATPTETVTPATGESPLATVTTESSAPPGPRPSPTVSNSAPLARLTVVTQGDDSLFVINAGAIPIPFADFCLIGNGTEVCGPVWGVDRLASGACVSIWKNRGRPNAPDVECEEVGERQAFEPNALPWKKSFQLFYRGERLAICEENGCVVEFAP